MIEFVKNELSKNIDEKYQKFSSSLIPNVDNVLGVRLPVLRKIAKKIQNKELFIKQNTNEYLELTLIETIVIGSLKTEFDKVFNYVHKIIPKINNWSTCDCLCSNLKIIKKHKKETLEQILKYSKSKNEFELRFYYVILLNYFIDDDTNFVLNEISKFSNEAYYAKMAVAWCLSICFIKNYNKTIEFITVNKIHNWVLKKGITKAIESYRLSQLQKEELKKLRKHFS